MAVQRKLPVGPEGGSAAQAVDAAQSEGRRLRRKRPRPSLYDDLHLADGRLAKPLVDAVPMLDATFRARLKRGLSPDLALRLPVQSPGPRRAKRQGFPKPVPHEFWPLRNVKLPDGSPAWVACIASGVSAGAFSIRRHRGWTVAEAATRPMRKRGRRIGGDDE